MNQFSIRPSSAEAGYSNRVENILEREVSPRCETQIFSCSQESLLGSMYYIPDLLNPFKYVHTRTCPLEIPTLQNRIHGFASSYL